MSYIGEERKKIILDLLELEGLVRTSDLSQKLKVSGEMVRRYLEELEREKRLKRIYGGAVKADATREELPHINRAVVQIEEKKKIGLAASALIEDNDVIFVDDGSTPMQVIYYLQNKQNITVIVYSFDLLNLIMELYGKGLFHGHIYLLGGRVLPRYSRVAGGLTEAMAENFHVDKALISVDGFTIDKGVTGFDLERGYLLRKVAGTAKLTVVMTDHTKFGSSCPYKILDLKDIDVVITDVAQPSQWMPHLEQKNIAWINAMNESLG